MLGRDRTQKSKVVKQADVVALSALLWERFPSAVHEANFRYYEPRTAHGSSLSPALHAFVSARLGDSDLAARYFRDAAAIDLSNHRGNAAGGVHIATLGGSAGRCLRHGVSGFEKTGLSSTRTFHRTGIGCRSRCNGEVGASL